MKTCKSCRTEKPFAEFYADKKNKDRRQGDCKTCRCASAAAYRDAFPEKAKLAKKVAQSKPVGKLKAKLAAKRFLAANPEKVRCHNLVNKAVVRGKLMRQPCSVCGSTPADAHHEDYAKPLEVIWFCRTHHSARHRELATAGVDPDTKL